MSTPADNIRFNQAEQDQSANSGTGANELNAFIATAETDEESLRAKAYDTSAVERAVGETGNVASRDSRDRPAESLEASSQDGLVTNLAEGATAAPDPTVDAGGLLGVGLAAQPVAVGEGALPGVASNDLSATGVPPVAPSTEPLTGSLTEPVATVAEAGLATDTGGTLELDPGLARLAETAAETPAVVGTDTLVEETLVSDAVDSGSNPGNTADPTVNPAPGGEAVVTPVDLQAVRAALLELRTDLRAEVSDIRSKIASENQEIKSSLQSFKALQKEERSLERDLKQDQNRIKKLDNQLDKLEQDIAKHSSRLDARVEKKSALEESMQLKKTELAKLEAEKTEITAKLESLSLGGDKAALKSVQSELKVWNKEWNSVNKQLTGMEKQVVKLEKQIDKLEHNMAGQQSKFDTLAEKKTGLEAGVLEKTALLETLSPTVDAAYDTWQGNRADRHELREELKESQQEISSVKKAIKGLFGPGGEKVALELLEEHGHSWAPAGADSPAVSLDAAASVDVVTGEEVSGILLQLIALEDKGSVLGANWVEKTDSVQVASLDAHGEGVDGLVREDATIIHLQSDGQDHVGTDFNGTNGGF